MNIGNIVSTVQAEPLDEVYEIRPLAQEDLEKFKVLVKAETTTAVRDEILSAAH